ncbi:MAG TPA: VOC family protein, partial [Candidatus Xenobia bacterium]
MAVGTEIGVGNPCWLGLMTSDPEAAKTFYGGVFGWTFRERQFLDMADRPRTPAGVYVTCLKNGRPVGAIRTMGSEMQKSGALPAWLIYFNAASAESIVRKTEALGGQVRVPAFAMREWGRMAVLADPVGAVFAVWEEGGGREEIDRPRMAWVKDSAP